MDDPPLAPRPNRFPISTGYRHFWTRPGAPPQSWKPAHHHEPGATVPSAAAAKIAGPVQSARPGCWPQTAADPLTRPAASREVFVRERSPAVTPHPRQFCAKSNGRCRQPNAPGREAIYRDRPGRGPHFPQKARNHTRIPTNRYLVTIWAHRRDETSGQRTTAAPTRRQSELRS